MERQDLAISLTALTAMVTTETKRAYLDVRTGHMYNVSHMSAWFCCHGLSPLAMQ